MNIAKKTRLRAQPRRFLFWQREPLLVLQVEETLTANEGAVEFQAWRDARVDDLT